MICGHVPAFPSGHIALLWPVCMLHPCLLTAIFALLWVATSVKDTTDLLTARAHEKQASGDWRWRCECSDTQQELPQYSDLPYKKVMFVTVMDDASKGCNWLLSAAWNGVPVHVVSPWRYLEQQPPIKFKLQWRTYVFPKMLQDFQDHDLLFVTDSYDVYFQRPLQQMLNAYHHIRLVSGKPIVVSAENNCWDICGHEVYPNVSHARYINTGMFAGPPRLLQEWWQWVVDERMALVGGKQRMLRRIALDQTLANLAMPQWGDRVALDTMSTIAHSYYRDGLCYNANQGTYFGCYSKYYPGMIHFNGPIKHVMSRYLRRLWWYDKALPNWGTVLVDFKVVNLSTICAGAAAQGSIPAMTPRDQRSEML